MLDAITPVVLTFNEEPNIGRALSQLRWARRIIVVDSGSTDRTAELCRGFPTVEFLVRPFDLHASQWNFGVSRISTPWALALDADYIVSDALAGELRSLEPPAEITGYEASFRYCIDGKPLRGSLYPPKVVLFKSESGRYEQDGHTQRLTLEGRTGRLTNRILHDDRKPFSSWLAAQHRYAALEADKLRTTPASELAFPDRLRKLLVVAPIAAPLHALFVRGTILDGWRGMHYAFQRGLAEWALTRELLRRRSGRRDPNR